MGAVATVDPVVEALVMSLMEANARIVELKNQVELLGFQLREADMLIDETYNRPYDDA